VQYIIRAVDGILTVQQRYRYFETQVSLKKIIYGKETVVPAYLNV